MKICTNEEKNIAINDFLNTTFTSVSAYNKKLNNLPNLYRLYLGFNFNKKINNLSQIYVLELGKCFK